MVIPLCTGTELGFQFLSQLRRKEIGLALLPGQLRLCQLIEFLAGAVLLVNLRRGLDEFIEIDLLPYPLFPFVGEFPD